MAEIVSTVPTKTEVGEVDGSVYGHCRLGHARTYLMEHFSRHIMSSLWCPVCQEKQED